MTDPNFDKEDEKPLDPAMEKVRRKMVRLLFISSSAIVLALMAVIGSIVYKTSKNSTRAAEATTPAAVTSAPVAAAQSVTLPKGFSIETTTIDGNRIWFMGTGADGKHRIIVHDIGTGKTLTQVDIVAQ